MKSPSRIDPSGTSFLQRKFFNDLKRRFILLKKKIYVYLVKEDQLKLIKKEMPTFAYAFSTDAERLQEFSGWLDDRQAEGVLEVVKGPAIRTQYDRWTDKYIDPAYRQGMRNAYIRAGYAAVTGLAADQWVGANFFAPFHQNRAELLYTRTFEDLKGITEATASSLRDVLAQGLIEGLNPRIIAQNINEKIDGIGIRRAEVLARTEIMRAHSEGSLDTYDIFEEEGVELLVEYLYTNDERVCLKCVEFGTGDDGNAKRFTIQESRGILPLHPQCRCVWVPVLK